MAKISPYGIYRAFNLAGTAALDGGLLYTYEAGTSTPKPTYTTAAGNVANPNPVVLDINGSAKVWLDVGGYKFVLQDKNGVEQFTEDNIDGGGAAGFGSQVIVTSTGLTLTSTYQNSVIVCTQSVTLSLISAAVAGDGYIAMIINRSSGNVTVAPDGAETINGDSSLVIPSKSSCTIHTNGITWYASTSLIEDGTVTPDKLSFGITGMVVPYAGSTAPTGWLLCYGQAVSRSTYVDLFTVIGTTYGAGDGTTTFNIPDMRGRSVIGKDDMGGTSANRITVAGCGMDGDVLGTVGGSEFTQTHTHTITPDPHDHTVPAQSGVGLVGGSNTVASTQSPNTTITTSSVDFTIANYGAGTSQNVQPGIVLNHIIKI